MNIRDTTIAKLQRISESLLQEVNDFIDFVVHKHHAEINDDRSDETLVREWSQWFDAVEILDVTPPEPATTYQQILLTKYRQQGLEL